MNIYAMCKKRNYYLTFYHLFVSLIKTLTHVGSITRTNSPLSQNDFRRYRPCHYHVHHHQPRVGLLAEPVASDILPLGYCYLKQFLSLAFWSWFQVQIAEQILDETVQYKDIDVMWIKFCFVNSLPNIVSRKPGRTTARLFIETNCILVS